MGVAAGVVVLLAGCNGRDESAGSASGDASPDRTSFAWNVGFGPDPSPHACDGDAYASSALQCPWLPAVCIDGGIAVNYLYEGCSSGACAWSKSDVVCARLGEGGTCVGGASEVGATTLVDGSAWAVTEGCSVPLGPAPVAPIVPCDPDAGIDAAICSPPPSVCATQLLGWLLYYDYGQCVAGQCTWQLRSRLCPGPAACSAGGCVYLGTSAPAVPN
jgi:hypothetical protein